MYLKKFQQEQPGITINPTLPVSVSKIKPKVVITDKAYKQGMNLCQRIPKLEWSGYAIYREHGNLITDPENFWVEVLEIFPMSIGTYGGVEQAPDSKIARHLMSYVKKGELPPSYGTVHSHHDMGVFFSGTDYSDLQRNALKHNYYVSIVFDNAGKVLTHIGQVASDTISGYQVRTVLDGEGKEHEVGTTEVPIKHATKALIDYQCITEYPALDAFEPWFVKQSDHIIKEHNKPKTFNTFGTSYGTGYGGYGTFGNKSTNSYGSTKPKNTYRSNASSTSRNPHTLFDNDTVGYTKDVCDDFLTKWMMGESKWVGTVSGTLQEVSNILAQASDNPASLEAAMDTFRDGLVDTFDEFYTTQFGVIDTDDVVVEVLKQCKVTIGNYVSYAPTRAIIIEAIDKVIEEEYVNN